MPSMRTRHFLYNLCGTGLPLLVALVALPIISREAGAARLGFMGLAWTVIGYLGLLDLGLSRVVVRRVATAQGSLELCHERQVVVRIASLLLAVCLPVALLLAVFLPMNWLLGANPAPDLQREAQLAWWIMMATVPFSVLAGVLAGVLDGRQWFGLSNTFKTAMGTWNFLGPVLLALWGLHGLPQMVAAVALGRILSTVANLLAVHRALPRLPRPVSDAQWRSPPMLPILLEGGWMTVSNVVGPIMGRLDRFIVASALTLGAAAYYFVPQELVIRVAFVPAALGMSLFPALARVHGHDLEAHRTLAARGLRATCAISLPLALGMAAFSSLGLHVWMGSDFAVQSAGVLAIMAVGFFGNSAAQLPFTVLQSAGRADLIARVHVLELPVFVAALWWLTGRYGIAGAAAAGTLRSVIDCAVLLALAHRIAPVSGLRDIGIGLVLTAGAAASLLWQPDPGHSFLGFWLLTIGLLISVYWLWDLRQVRS